MKLNEFFEMLDAEDFLRTDYIVCEEAIAWLHKFCWKVRG